MVSVNPLDPGLHRNDDKLKSVNGLIFLPQRVQRARMGGKDHQRRDREAALMEELVVGLSDCAALHRPSLIMPRHRL